MSERESINVRLQADLLTGDAPANAIRVRFVRAGQTQPIRGYPRGVRLTPSALQAAAAAGLFDGVAVFFKHILDDGRDLRDLAGVTAAAHWNSEEQAVDGLIHVYGNAAGNEFHQLARDWRSHRSAGIPVPDVGVSLDSYFLFEDGDVPVAREMIQLSSIDIVFRPAAEGRILADQRSARQFPPETAGTLNRSSKGGNSMEQEQVTPQEEQNAPNAAGEATTAAAAPAPVVAGNHRLQGSSFGTASDSPAPDMAEASATTTPAVLPNAAANGLEWARILREQAVGARLAASNLPRATQRRLANAAYESPDALEDAIEEARAELAALAEEEVIQLGGTPPRGGRISNMVAGVDRANQALHWLFGDQDADYPDPGLRDLRAVYHALTGDIEFRGVFQPDRVQFTGATTSTLSDSAANAMNKVIVQQFSNLTFWRWYEQITYPTPNDGSVQDMQWTTLGGVGNLATVPEKGAYDEIDMGDVAESDSFVKYGGYVPITLELIRNSDIQRLQAVPKALAIAAVRTRSAKVSAIFTTASGLGPTLEQDSTALFDATAHSNLLTTALGTTEAAWKTVAQAIFQQTEVTSGKVLGLFPKYCLVPVELYHTALSIFGYGDGLPTSYEPFSQDRGAADPRPVPLVVPDWTDANNWAAITDPRVFPVIHISYAQAPGGGSHPAPELFTVSSPTAGLMFSNDVLPIKIRDWFAVGVNGWRGIHKSNVA